MVTITVGFGGRSGWPNGKPIKSERLPDGRYCHTLEDGRLMTVGAPSYRIDYLSTWVGSSPGETYEIKAAIGGLTDAPGWYWAWNFDIGELGELRHYRFDKTVRITALADGWAITGEALREQLGG